MPADPVEVAPNPSTAWSHGTAAVSTRHLTKQFGPVTALWDLSVEMPQGVVGLVGANGAGKSTLIKILLGLLPPTSGDAQILGLDARTDGLAIRRVVGYMPESDCLPPDVSATELVVHLARMSGLPGAAARERAADTLRHVGLYEERYRPIGGYSTGMKQRVKLAQALVHDPQLVLLDEPTNGLDPAGRDEMLDLIRRIARRLRHLGAGDLAPAGRARADRRPRRRHRGGRAAALHLHRRGDGPVRGRCSSRSPTGPTRSWRGCAPPARRSGPTAAPRSPSKRPTSACSTR